MIEIFLLLCIAVIVCITTIIHALIANKQKRWEILHGIESDKDPENY